MAEDRKVRISGVKFVMTPIDNLMPDPRNSRVHSEDNIRKLRASLREFGFVKPVVADDQGNMLAGHGILEAARQEGCKEVPCVFVSGLTEEQRRAYLIADNRLAEDSAWNNEMLKLELGELDALAFDVSATGFALEDFFPEAPDMDFDEDGDGDTASSGKTQMLTCPKCGFSWSK